MELCTAVMSDVPVLTVDEVVALEQRIAASGTPLSELMARAGAAVAEYVQVSVPAPARVLVLCGSGNNGGDGWVVARLLASVEAGYAVSVLSARAVEDLRAEPARGAALEALEAVTAVKQCDGYVRYDFGAAVDFATVDVIVDCLLGTGFSGSEVAGVSASLIERANATSALRVACDVPSGLSARTGAVAQPCFLANATITMLAVKEGMLASGAAGALGQLYLAPLE